MAKAKITGTVNSTPISAPPTISSITYANGTFTVKWTRGENYSGAKASQNYSWYLLGETTHVKGKAHAIQSINKTALPANATSVSINIDLSLLYPNAGKPVAHKFVFEMAGKQNKKLWSNAVVGTYEFYPPPVPTLVRENGDQWNNAIFSWGTEGIESYNPATDVILQTVLKKDAPDDVKGLAEWGSASTVVKPLSGDQSYSETIPAGESYKRCVRVKTRGIGGDSAWAYADKVYAQSKAATNVEANVIVDENNNTITVSSSYDAPSDATRPVDVSTVQYLIAVPDINQTVPEGATFTDLIESADVSGINASSAVIDSIGVGYDKVMFVRIKTQYENQTPNYSATQIKYRGPLKAPSGLSVSINQYTYKATITATNESEVEDSYLAVYYKDAKTNSEFICGYIPHGSTSVTVQCMNWTNRTPVVFGVRAIQGSVPVKNTGLSYDVYGISTVNMQSEMQWQGGAVPVAPTSVSAQQVGDDATIAVSWKWAWEEADMAELSWSDHKDAWGSTDDPETYDVSNLNASTWRISNLALGLKWYVKVRLARHVGDEVTYGPYSNAIEVDLSAPPMTPFLRLSKQIVKMDESVTASWEYGTGDGTGQSSADIYEVVNGSYRKIGSVKTQQNFKISTSEMAKKFGWTVNSQHSISMRVWSDSSRYSPYASPVVLTIANPLTASITVGGGFELVNGAYELKALPATVTVTGAGNAGTSTLVIERAQPYDLELPDESMLNGYDGETIFLKRYAGQGAVTINRGDLIGRLDDTAPYRLVGIVEDSYGQTATITRDFSVNWTHQAIDPEGTAVLDEEQGIVRITPTAPTGVATGDYVNIYRLSADKPQLIYEGAEFGETYVDPYPTIGEYGGYRLAFFTANGDFITAGKYPAVLDLPVEYDVDYHLFDFKTTRIPLYYNASSSNEWQKNFKATRYLGGRIVGDWTDGVSRTGSAEAVTVTILDDGVKEALRRMADYAGLCHVRTKDGSNIVANVNVTESFGYEKAGQVTEFQLSYEAVDNPSFDAMTEDAWEGMQ